MVSSDQSSRLLRNQKSQLEDAIQIMGVSSGFEAKCALVSLPYSCFLSSYFFFFFLCLCLSFANFSVTFVPSSVPVLTMRIIKVSLLWWFSCSVVSDSATPRTVAQQASLSMGFSRQEYWSGLPFRPPRDLPNPGTETPESSAWQASSLPLSHQGSPQISLYFPNSKSNMC